MQSRPATMQTMARRRTKRSSLRQRSPAPSKVARIDMPTTSSQSPATATRARSRARTRTSPSTDDPFALVGPDAHQLIVSYLLAVMATPTFESPFGFYCLDLAQNGLDCTREVTKWKDMSASEQARYVTRCERYLEFRSHLLYTKRNLSLVNKLWRDMAQRVIHQCNAPPSAILTPHDFGALKEKVSRLDLTPFYDDFIAIVETKWNAFNWGQFQDGLQTIGVPELAKISPLQAFVSKYCDGRNEILAKVCAEEYRRFILVKCVETQARGAVQEPKSSQLEMWKQPCRPTEPVAMFWRAHMLHSNGQYDKDCQTLIGQTIGDKVDCGANCGNGGIINKQRVLFAFELQFPKKTYYQCPDYDSNTSFHIWDSLFDDDGEISGFYQAIDDMIYEICNLSHCLLLGDS